MVVIAAIWWVAFFAAFGLCIGSFLNVIIYRVPRDISLRNPRWSCCPGCGSAIAWYDNLPVLSYLRLAGRCRNCRMAIAARYPIVEMCGALIVLLLLDTFVIGQMRFGKLDGIGLAWLLSEHWPILVAHIVLFTSLLAMSAIDLEHYWVDVRFTHLATAAGFILHAIWSPPQRSIWPAPSNTWATAALAATVIFMLTLIALRIFFPVRHLEPQPQQEDGDAQDEPTTDQPDGQDETDQQTDADAPFTGTNANATFAEAETDSAPAASTPSGDIEPAEEIESDGRLDDSPDDSLNEDPARPGFGGLILATLVCLTLLLIATTEVLDASALHRTTIYVRWIPPLVLFFIIILLVGAPHKAADTDIIDAIEAERSTARKVVAQELLILLPTIATAVVLLCWAPANITDTADRYLNWSIGYDWKPLQGLSRAALGFLIGGGIGWAVRILATFAIGKEAFGVGDIHMMAAAGCVCGWPVVLMGFVLSSFLALLGWILVAPFKRTRAIPLGPWLSISFLIVVVFYKLLVNSQPVENILFVIDSIFPAPALLSLGT